MRESLRDRLAKHFPADGLGWKIPGATAALITIVTAVVALVVWARGPLSDFLAANAEVWHLLLAVGGIVGLGLVIVWLQRRRGSDQGIVDWSRFHPKEILRYDVLWPIDVYRGTSGPEFRAQKPTCPTCHTPLGLDMGEGDEPLPLPAGWKDMTGEGMTFRCPTDRSAYDLTKWKIPMLWATRNVEAAAEGRYNSALREAGL